MSSFDAVLEKVPLARRVIRRILPDARTRLLQKLPKHSVGAEVGVWKGGFSVMILGVVRPRELHLVDPWAFQAEYPDRWYGGAAAVDQKAMDAIYESVQARFAEAPNVIVHRRYSHELRQIFGERQLDWIYIDGDHSERAVKQDLETAYDVVVPSGWIAGDDYFWQDENGDYTVQSAVDHFCSSKSLTLRVIEDQFLIQKSE